MMRADAHVVDTTPAVHVHPDHPLDVVIERFAHSDGTLPVVSRNNTRQIEGVITADAILARVSRQPADGAPSDTPPQDANS